MFPSVTATVDMSPCATPEQVVTRMRTEEKREACEAQVRIYRAMAKVRLLLLLARLLACSLARLLACSLAFDFEQQLITMRWPRPCSAAVSTKWARQRRQAT